MDTFQSLGAPSRSRFGVFKLSKPKRLRARHGLPNRISEGLFVYRAISELDVDAAWGTWLGEQRGARGELKPVLLKHTGDSNRTRAGADALWLEALLTSKLEGSQVVALVDYGVVDGRPFAVYDFEEGVFLAQVLEGLRERNIQLPSSVAVGIVLQACDLVGRLHELRLDEEDEAVGGFIHGSLCPRNFVLTDRGDVRVMGLVGVRPVGRVVGREHVPAAALDYASPDLLGGAPVTPAVDVYSLGAVLSELLGPDQLPGDELGRIVRVLLSGGSATKFSTVRGLAGALQEAVRRTGTVVARQSIAAQVRGICEQYLLERHKQVRALLDTEWPDQREAGTPESGVAATAPAAISMSASPLSASPLSASPLSVSPLLAAPLSGSSENTGVGSANGVEIEGVPGSVPTQSPLLDNDLPVRTENAILGGKAASGPEAATLGQYDENADDAVTRFMDDVEVGAEITGQTPAWMNDNEPSDEAAGGFSKWAVGGLMGVLIAICSVAAIVAWSAPSSVPQVPAVAEAEERGSGQRVAKASGGDSEKTLPALAVDSLPEAVVVGAQLPVAGKSAGSSAAAGSLVDSSSASVLAASELAANERAASEVKTPQGGAENVDGASALSEAKAAKEQASRRRASARRRAKRRQQVRSTSRSSTSRSSAARGNTDELAAVELPDTVAAPKGRAAEPEASVSGRAAEIVREMAAEDDIEYEEAPKMAFLSVDASPYANVFIDGKKVGVTPIVSLELAPGPHRMVAKNADGETKRYTLMLEAGRTETVKITW